ncbi:hypothetical protein PPTG_20876 [Phytophthora nicotianae INRA-310]|uniref:Uncharacterized protein n=3 Tax=Phytophthora nicotianae TaxID=4792 RepID=W2RBH4_PHYN3|nr:hypothetical protein PPTG_20876 [Phytophthora nicotianae INRA-310]ETN22044.1 hypothetical protein PPTG_20876 [Phytophthora nicotianae INRA-310]
MTKPNLSDIERKAAIDELLWISINGTLPRGTYAKVATGMGCDPTTISAIWNRYAATGDTGVRGGEWISRIKKNSGRKRKNRDEVREKLASVPIEDRSVERRAAASAGLSRYMVRQAVKEVVLARRMPFVKPALTPNSKLRRVEHALSFVDDRTLQFEPMYNMSKRFIPKTMFLAALARPRYDPHRKQEWDGKGLLARESDSCNQSKMAQEGSHQIIFVQQDNAKPHVPPSDPAILTAGIEGGWNIRLLCQAPNSPEFNALDLGVFNSMQCIQHHIPRKDTKALIDSVESAFQQLKPHTVNDIFLTLQACMLCILQNEEGLYKLPHLGKAKLRTKKRIPVSLNCSRELYEAAIALLASANRCSALLYGA